MKIINAIEYMIKAHNNQYRKKTKIDYFTHPLGVMNILIEEKGYTGKIDENITEDLIIAGLFHDLNEDAKISIEEISEKFGKEVGRLVKSSSEPEELKNNPNERGTWKKRKEHTLKEIPSLDYKSKLLICADKLDNLRAINKDIITIGADKTWSKFNAPKEDIKWYYEETINLLREDLSGTRMFRLLEIEVEKIFG